MSIACLGLVPSINVQGVNVESNGAQLGGTYSNISQSNDAIPNLDIPNATWVQGVGVSTDPDIPNGLLFSCNLNNPVSPNIGALELLPVGGSGAGNGSIVGLPGDLIVSGSITAPDLAGTGSFTAVGVDSNGVFTTSATQGYYGKTTGCIVVGSGIFQEATFTDSSYAKYNLAENICTLFINVSGKVNASSGANQNLFAINMIGTGSVNIPEIDPNYIDGAPTSNFITMFGYLNNANFPNNSVPGLAYLIQGVSAITVYMSPSINFSADDQVQFIGTVSYPIASLP